MIVKHCVYVAKNNLLANFTDDPMNESQKEEPSILCMSYS